MLLAYELEKPHHKGSALKSYGGRHPDAAIFFTGGFS
jgi:hypothetical protein